MIKLMLAFVFCSAIITTMGSTQQGKITTNGVILRAHENATIVFLTQYGYDIELLVPIMNKGTKNPDIRMIGLNWEIKCPTGKSANTIKRSFKTALRQSKNIIFDLRNSKMLDKVNISKLEKEFTDIKAASRLIIITKSHELLDLSRQR